ncbi:tripartite tricarboxylate transporter TctB family protein [Chloroflexi bacterium TSY]|nr:tripartite tricarboxylate transporter TctB family protein [Chloroflexi bacterium TSY]
MENYTTDRVAGVILLVIAIGYTVIASGLKPTLLSANEPLGPGAFPMLLGLLLAIFSLLLAIKPSPDPAWPKWDAWVKMALILVTFVVYAYLLKPLGFVVSTALEMFALSLIFQGPLLKSLIASFAFSLFLYLLFSYALGLGLPRGILFFL